MSKFSKLGRREKNKWQRELEQIAQDEIDSKLDVRMAELEESYWQDIKDGLFDDYDYCEDDWYDLEPSDYEDYDTLTYIDEIGDWHFDSRVYADTFTPGCHVQNGKDVYLVLTTNQFANLRTGEVVRWFDHVELIWGG